MVLILPVTKLLADAVMRINKGNMATRDERMKIVDEMFNSVSHCARVFLVAADMRAADQIYQILCLGAAVD